MTEERQRTHAEARVGLVAERQLLEDQKSKHSGSSADLASKHFTLSQLEADIEVVFDF